MSTTAAPSAASWSSRGVSGRRHPAARSVRRDLGVRPHAAADAVDAKGNVIVERGHDLGDPAIDALLEAGISQVKACSVLTCGSASVCARCATAARWPLASWSTSVRLSASSPRSPSASLARCSPCAPSTRAVFVGGADIVGGPVCRSCSRRASRATALRSPTWRDGSGWRRPTVLQDHHRPRRRERGGRLRQVSQASASACSSTRTGPSGCCRRRPRHCWAAGRGGFADPHEARVLGLREVQVHLVKEVQEVYRAQGVSIRHDKRTSRSSSGRCCGASRSSTRVRRSSCPAR